MIIMGIDPGQKGGVAIIVRGEVSVYFPMPDCNGLSDKIGIWGRDFKMCYVEKVHSMPKQGVASTFKFGKHYGEILGILTALQIPYQLVTPQAWKKVVLEGLDWKGKGKEVAIEYVQRRYPSVNLLATERSRKPHDGMADAICIARYGEIMEGKTA